ncbi:MAG: RNA 2',3'-cyclic phosphodiesterase [Pseudomonadota bacterium]
MRAFIGCPLTERDRTRLDAWRNTHLAPPWRLVPLPNLHLTLCFLGAQPPPVLTALGGRLCELERLPAGRARGIAVQPFPVPEARLLALELAPDPALSNLQQAAAALATALGLCCEDRAFRPHITLARGRGARRSWPVELELTFDTLGLFGSLATPAGPSYPLLSRVSLGPAPSGPG